RFSKGPWSETRSGGRAPETNRCIGRNLVERISRRAVSYMVRPPRQWPKKAKGKSSKGRISEASSELNFLMSTIGFSSIRPSRPGGSTATTSMAGSRDSDQLRKTAEPPPAKGKQNSRSRGEGLGPATTNHLLEPLFRDRRTRFPTELSSFA